MPSITHGAAVAAMVAAEAAAAAERAEAEDGPRMDFARDKTAFKPKSRRWDRYFVLLVSPHVDDVGAARVRRHTYVDMNHADLETQTADVISICGDRSRLISPSAVVPAITCPCHRSHDTSGLLRAQSSFYV